MRARPCPCETCSDRVHCRACLDARRKARQARKEALEAANRGLAWRESLQGRPRASLETLFGRGVLALVLVAWLVGLAWMAPSCGAKAQAGWDGLGAVVDELKGIRRAIERLGDRR